MVRGVPAHGARGCVGVAGEAGVACAVDEVRGVARLEVEEQERSRAQRWITLPSSYSTVWL